MPALTPVPPVNVVPFPSTPADDVPTEQADAIADVFDTLDQAAAPADDVNPFAIEGL